MLKKFSIFSRSMQHNYVAEKFSIFSRSMQHNYVAKKCSILPHPTQYDCVAEKKLIFFHIRCNITMLPKMPRKTQYFHLRKSFENECTIWPGNLLKKQMGYWEGFEKDASFELEFRQKNISYWESFGKVHNLHRKFDKNHTSWKNWWESAQFEPESLRECTDWTGNLTKNKWITSIEKV